MTFSFQKLLGLEVRQKFNQGSNDDCNAGLGNKGILFVWFFYFV